LRRAAQDRGDDGAGSCARPAHPAAIAAHSCSERALRATSAARGAAGGQTGEDRPQSAQDGAYDRASKAVSLNHAVDRLTGNPLTQMTSTGTLSWYFRPARTFLRSAALRPQDTVAAITTRNFYTPDHLIVIPVASLSFFATQSPGGRQK